MPDAPRVLVVGCGGIGGTVAAHLAQHDPDALSEVVALSTNAEIARAVNERGFRLRGAEGEADVPGRVLTSLPDRRAFDFVLLATQPPQVEAAARDAAPWLAPDGAMVVLQNGLCEERIARIVGPERVLGAVVAFGASMPEPGVYDRTSPGGFQIGRVDGAADPRLEQLAILLERVGPVQITRNLAGARWSKLAINCAISTLGTIGGDRLGALMRLRTVRRLGLEVITEAVRVARATGVALEKVSGTVDLDWLALTDAERASAWGSASLLTKHSMMLAVGARYRRLRSSMLAAIERGRTPAVDFLNGEIVERGAALGVPTPFNAAARDTVWAIARGEQAPSVEALMGVKERAER